MLDARRPSGIGKNKNALAGAGAVVDHRNSC